jgi:outer membrane receptor protein involved in Fe transport
MSQSVRVSLATLALGAIGALPVVAADTASDSLQEVVVTGSRIARPNLESTVPVVSISGDQLFETGNTSVGDLLNDLPALRSTFAQSNSSRFLGTAGLNLLDLRGLGAERTLVLVNGRRMVAADILGAGVSPDANTIPTDLVERIDVVTGGSSAVYGSDAIAGVVNFVLKKNYEGLHVRAQGGESKYHDGKDVFLSALGGTNFADDRGNVSVAVEYANQEPFFASDRPNLAANGNFVTIDTDPSGSDGNPDRTFVRDIRSTTIAIGGLMQFAPTAASGLAPCGRAASGAAFRCTYIYQPDGSLVPQTGTRVGIAPNGSFDGGNGTTGRERDTLGIFPKLDRVSLNMTGHYTISEAFEPFVEAKYVRTNSIRYGSPAFFQGGTIDGFYERPRFDNPFLTAAAKASIQAARASVGLAPLGATTRFSLFKNLTDLGGRQEDAKRETSRFVVGVGGKIGSDWNYEVSLNKGQFREDTQVLNNLDLQRFILAMDSTRDPSGKIICRSQLDPEGTDTYDGTDFALAKLPGDIAACVPLNPFGEGNITPEMRNYVNSNTTSVGRINQFVASAFLSGNSNKWFTLPAGPVGIALGAEYRTESNYFKADDLVSSGITFYNALPLLDPPSFGVKELYTELRVPLLKDKTLFKDLTLSAAARVSSYKGNTGTVVAYNGGLDWEPVDGLRFRGGFARSIRAPNLVELFSGQGQNFATVVDPCSLRNIGTGAATRTANCRAAGIPANYDYVYTASLEILSGGNPNLKEETSDSLTLGAVFQPSFVPGLSLTVDYFDIKVDDVISSPTAQDILDACYDARDINNQFCGLFQRAGAGGAATGEEAFQILEGSLQQLSLNYAKLTTKGIDTELAYSHNVGWLGKLGGRLVYTHTLERNDFLNPVDPGKADQVLMELGDPKDAFNLDIDLKHGDLTLAWQMRYISKMVLNAYEDTFSVQGRPPQNEDYADVRFYPSAIYHDVRAAYDFNDQINGYVGIDNVANKVPPYGLTGTGAGSAIYEPRGRFFYAGVKLNIQ